MNDATISRLLNSIDMSEYIYDLAIVFNTIQTIVKGCEYIIAYNDDHNLEIRSITVFISKYKINHFLEMINSIKYNSDIEIYPEFQYLNIIITRLKSILIELSILGKKTELIISQTIDNVDFNVAIKYIDFISEISSSDVPIDMSSYNNLANNVISNILNLKEKCNNATTMFNLLQYSFNSYMIYS